MESIIDITRDFFVRCFAIISYEAGYFHPINVFAVSTSGELPTALVKLLCHLWQLVTCLRHMFQWKSHMINHIGGNYQRTKFAD